MFKRSFFGKRTGGGRLTSCWYYSGWKKFPNNNPGMVLKPPAKNGISAYLTISTDFFSGFLVHQLHFLGVGMQVCKPFFVQTNPSSGLHLIYFGLLIYIQYASWQLSLRSSPYTLVTNPCFKKMVGNNSSTTFSSYTPVHYHSNVKWTTLKIYFLFHCYFSLP